MLRARSERPVDPIWERQCVVQPEASIRSPRHALCAGCVARAGQWRKTVPVGLWPDFRRSLRAMDGFPLFAPACVTGRAVLLQDEGAP